MALYHILTSPVADFTGTVTVFDSAGSTQTAAASQIVRPSDWNSAHSQVFMLSGNTSGNTTFGGTNVVFYGGSNITVSGTGDSVYIHGESGGAGETQLTAYAQSNTTQSSTGTMPLSSIMMAGAGIASVGVSNGSFVVSATQTSPVMSNAIQSVGSATGSGTNTSRFAADDHVHAGVFSMGVSTGGNTAGDTRVDVGRFVLVGGNNITMSQQTAAGALNSVVVSAASQSNQSGGAYFVGNTTGQSSSSTYDARSLSIDGAGIVSAGWSNGSVRISATQSNQAFSAGGGSSAFQTLGFSDNGYASWTNTNGSVALTEVRGSFYAVSNTTQSSSGTQNLDAVSFAGAGIASVGVSNGSVVISVPAGGGAGDGGVFAGVSNLGNTAGSTGTVSTGNFVLVGSNGISLSQSTGGAGSAATVTINGQTIATVSSYWALDHPISNNAAFSNAAIYIQYLQVPNYVSASRVDAFVYLSLASSATANTFGMRWSVQGMVLTNDSANKRLMSLSSGSTQTTWTLASNSAGATQILGSGIRPISCPLNMYLTPGQYFLAYCVSTNTFSSGTATTALGQTISYVGGNNLMSASNAMVGDFNVATATSNNSLLPMGVVSGASSSIPLTISYSQINMQASMSRANIQLLLRN